MRFVTPKGKLFFPFLLNNGSIVRKAQRSWHFSFLPMSMEQLFFIFSNEGLCTVYEAYLQKNMAWENYGFFHAVQEFRECADPETRDKLAEEIFEKYIKVDAIHELGDLDFRTRQQLVSAMKAPTPEMFDELAEIAADSLANSTITDFLKDPTYTQYFNSQFSPTPTCSERNGGVLQSLHRSFFACIPL